MVKHLSGFVPFCEVHEFLFFYHLYSTTGKKALQFFFLFFFQTSASFYFQTLDSSVFKWYSIRKFNELNR